MFDAHLVEFPWAGVSEGLVFAPFGVTVVLGIFVVRVCGQEIRNGIFCLDLV